MNSRLLAFWVLGACLVLSLAVPMRKHQKQRESFPGSVGEKQRRRDIKSDKDAMRFLKHYHWMKPSDGNSVESSDDGTGIASVDTDEESIVEMPDAIINYQKHNHIPVTGKVDMETLEEMNKPRCGMPDEGMMDHPQTRHKRYALAGPKWGKRGLTYFFENYTPDLNPSDTEEIIQKAFDVYSAVSPLRFTLVRQLPADIVIKFAPGDHGDGAQQAFDGPGGTLAHAYFPHSDLIGGDAHFDEEETWTIGVSNGINLFQVAAHEFGHSLGLSHSDVRSALMYPTYTGYQPDFQLDSDDIAGIQALYGPKPGNTPEPTTSTTPKQPPTTYIATTQPPTTSTKTTQPPTTSTAKTQPPNTPKPTTSTTATQPTTTSTTTTQPPTTSATTTQPPTTSTTTTPRPATTTTTSQPPTISATETTTTPPVTSSTQPPSTSQKYTTNPSTTSSTTSANTNPPMGGPSACDINKWDAVLTTQDGTTYFFAGSYYYRQGSSIPHSIASDWGISGTVSAALTLSNGYSLLFQGNTFYLFENRVRYDNYVRYTRYHLPGIPDVFDAAWSHDDSFYVAQGAYYWGYYDYPRDFNYAWWGAPDVIDAATTIQGNPHFFRGSYYYKCYTNSYQVYGGARSVSRDFFNCPSNIKVDIKPMELETARRPESAKFDRDSGAHIEVAKFIAKLDDAAGKVVDDITINDASSAPRVVGLSLLVPVSALMYWL